MILLMMINTEKSLSPKGYLGVIRPHLRDLNISEHNISEHKPKVELNKNNINNKTNNSKNNTNNSNNSNNSNNEENDRAEWKIQLVMQNNSISGKTF